ncbi:hypothetical protein ALQ72_01103 [Pseudomonas syringae pv. maculicola]|uniref:hypothetical protein n=1 Tax=Pseudomonas syringae group genomosp. 3 TaxID=251701 RepID=UPI000EFF54D9|nr:hypothetical protein [Pseudomonas syringae group genomosp. 3]RMM83733.1 hypothetical protein ALQ72_01103 [Pseudomonas syringae pv. maculicola]
MIGRILEAITLSQRGKGPVLEIQLWSKEAIEAVMLNPEFKDGKFIGIPVKVIGENNQYPEDDFILVTRS